MKRQLQTNTPAIECLAHSNHGRYTNSEAGRILY